jgi:hypothetical protein
MVTDDPVAQRSRTRKITWPEKAKHLLTPPARKNTAGMGNDL